MVLIDRPTDSDNYSNFEYFQRLEFRIDIWHSRLGIDSRIKDRAIMPIIKPASVAPGAPAQHKQPSRKGKKAWRKNVDVTEIQEGLEEVREEIIKGYDFNSIPLNPY